MTPEQALAAQWPVAMPTVAPVELLPMPQTPKDLTPPNGLTQREMDVLRLLAQGLTSAQIAEQLVIGLVTVNTHVRSIYSKPGVALRSTAMGWSMVHQLV